MNSKDSDSSNLQTLDSNSNENNHQRQRIQSNRKMLDLRQQVEYQNQVIRDLKIERDRLTKELASRLFFVEAQLLREQKYIESLLKEKDQYIRFQGLQIESLKCMMSQMDFDPCNTKHCTQRGRTSSNLCTRRSKMIPPLSKRYSVALDEYMKDDGIVSRALPVVVQIDPDGDKRDSSHRAQSICTRTLSLPELRCSNPLSNWDPTDCYACFSNFVPDHSMETNVIDELAARRWTSDCDSEHSDSLDSGISSPSIKSRSMHLDEIPIPIIEDDHRVAKQDGGSRRRSSSIGNFLNRKFSSSSTQLEKIKDDEELSSNTSTNGRRHSSFSEVKSKDAADAMQKDVLQKPRFISSANRNFGTNHRSVTKPRDIKFRKLFKFRRRTAEPVDQSAPQCEDYMTV